MKPKIERLTEARKDAYYQALRFCDRMRETGEWKVVMFYAQVGKDRPTIVMFAEITVDADTLGRLRETERILTTEGDHAKT